jgi:hypothetical protein
MPIEPESDLDNASLAHIVQELEHLKDGLRLLGVKQCCHCRKYFRCPDGRTLFDAGQPVCYGCVQDWWLRRAPALGGEERRTVEHKLFRWLVSYHDAKVIPQTEQMPPADGIELKIVAACERCDGTGKDHGGKACGFCGGLGTIWLVALRPEFH